MQTRKKIALIARYIALVIVTILMLTPIVWTLISTLRPSNDLIMGSFLPKLSDFTLESYITVLENGDFFTYMGNSVYYAGGSALICALFSLLGAYSLSRFDYPGRKVLQLAIVYIMMIPVLMVLVPLYFIFSKMSALKPSSIVIIYAAGNIPFCMWLCKTYLDGIPKELDQAAAIDGCGRLKCLLHVITPLAVPCIISGVIIVFVNGWNESIYASVFLARNDWKPVTAGILSLGTGKYANNWGALNTCSIIACLPVMVLFFALQRYFIGGMVAGAIKG